MVGRKESTPPPQTTDDTPHPNHTIYTHIPLSTSLYLLGEVVEVGGELLDEGGVARVGLVHTPKVLTEPAQHLRGCGMERRIVGWGGGYI